MALEIERKFLVVGDFKSEALKSEQIRQGYLSIAPECTVRVRQKGERVFLTVKGKSTESGLTRIEWEKELETKDADELFQLCQSSFIDKTRYYVPFKNVVYEVDVFDKENKGLVIAELELKDENQKFEKPSWLGEEVTGDIRYYNLYLSEHPFSKWK